MTLRRASLLVVFLLGACKAKLAVDVEVDGKQFTPKSCRSGQPNGFAGIDLTDADGTRLRLVLQTDGSSQAFLFPPSTQQGVLVGTCGPMSVSTQNSTINDVRNVEGTATLDCSGNGHSVKGTVKFKNCH